jgi:hypothetical protein
MLVGQIANWWFMPHCDLPVCFFLLKVVDFSLVFLSSVSIAQISPSQPSQLYRVCQVWLPRKLGTSVIGVWLLWWPLLSIPSYLYVALKSVLWLFCSYLWISKKN